MFSDVVKSALETEVIGQTRAVNSVVRGVTRLVSGMTPRERSLCAYLFMGPTGTGKTHLVRTLARMLHGDEHRSLVVDCSHIFMGDPWTSFVSQLAPLFTPRPGQDPGSLRHVPPLSIIQIEFLERAPSELAKGLASALETGQLPLADGSRGSLRGCLVVVTSSLCSREILDEAPRIGFSGSLEEDEQETDRVYQQCYEAAVERFGGDFVGGLDAFLIFHRLQEDHLSAILDRRVARMNEWLTGRGLQYELHDEARAFLLEKGVQDLRLGARDLVRAHQKFVEFPVADLLVSGRIPPGGLVRVGRVPDKDHLHFSVDCAPSPTAAHPYLQEIPVG